jgi:Mrp family chromosome partitioning ATPase
VADAEAKVEQYRSKSNLFMGTNNTSLSNQQLGDSNAQLASARSAKADAEAKSRIIREALRSGAPVEFSDIINSELLRRLSEQRVTLRAQLAEQSSTLLDQHPRIKELRAQIGDLERMMRSEAERLSRSLENDAKLAGARVEALSASLDQLKNQASSNNEQDVQLRALERDAKSQRDLLESYLAKYREATARDNIGATSPDARVISTAVVSSVPSWPKKLPTVLVAALGMLALSVGFVLTGELLNTVPVQPAVAPAFDYKPVAAAPVAPIVVPPAVEPAAQERRMASPPLQSQMAHPAHAQPTGQVPSDSIEGLAAELASAGEAGRRISVVGARRNMGATQATITLARALAKSARVVLVDLALDAPGLSAIASDPSGPGISELIRGSASFGQIVTRDRYSRVHVVTAGGVKGDSAAIFNAQRLSITLEALGRSYDYVVVDAGALRDAPTERIAQFATRAVLVADELDDPATASAREALLAAGFANVSVLVNPPQGPQSDSSGTRAAA